MNAEKRTLHASPSSVKRVVLDKPLKAALESKTKRGEKSDVMLTGQDLAAIEAVLGGHRAAHELLAVPEHSTRGSEPVAEELCCAVDRVD